MLSSVFRDNPIITKHIRSRLRRQHLVPAFIVVVVLCVWIDLVHAMDTGADSHGAIYYLALIQGFILFVLGSCQVVGSLSHAKEQGLLDFHRITPQKPLKMAVGFLLGAPIREIILFACTIPFMLPFLGFYRAELLGLGMPIYILMMLCSAFFFYALAMLIGLASPSSRGATAGVIIVVSGLHLVSMISMAQYFPFISHFTILPSLVSMFEKPSEYFDVPWISTVVSPILLGLVYQALFGTFLFMAGIRKLHHERTYAFSRPMAVAMFGCIGVLLLSDLIPAHRGRYGWQFDGPAAIGFFAYIVLIAGILITIGLTPNRGDLLHGIRHARKFGLLRPPLWTDRAPNWAPLLSVSILALALGAYATSIISAAYSWGWGMRAMAPGATAAIIAAGTILYFGAAKQYFDARIRKGASSYFALTIFLLWIVPLLLAVLVSIGGSDDSAGPFYALSPLSGLGVYASGELTGPEDGFFLRGVAPLVPWALALLFGVLAAKATRELEATLPEPTSISEAQ